MEGGNNPSDLSSSRNVSQLGNGSFSSGTISFSGGNNPSAMSCSRKVSQSGNSSSLTG